MKNSFKYEFTTPLYGGGMFPKYVRFFKKNPK